MGRPRGEPKRDNPESLVVENLGLVYRVVRKYQRAGACERDDLIQEGLLGLTNAARLYDPDRGVRFSTYGWLAIEHRVRRYVRAQQQRPHVGWDETTPEPVVHDRSAEDTDNRDLVESLLSGLAPRYRQMVRSRFGLDGRRQRTLGEIGQRAGVTKERVRWIVTKALATMRDAGANPGAATR